MGDKTDVWQGTLALMVLKTLATMGPQHGYGLARRIEQTSGGKLALNYGTLYPALLKLEQEGAIAAEWGASENNRRAKFYRLTRAGRRLLAKEERSWEDTTAILARFLAPERAHEARAGAPDAGAADRPRLGPGAASGARRRDRQPPRAAHRRQPPRGLTPDEARRQARLELGGIESMKEAYRDQRHRAVVEHTVQDIRLALRQLARTRGSRRPRSWCSPSAWAAAYRLRLRRSGPAAAAALPPSRRGWSTSPRPTPQIPRAALSYDDYLDWKR